VPDFSKENNNDLIKSFLNFVSTKPETFFDSEKNEPKELFQQISRNFVFSSDNIFKLIQIAYKLYSGVPIIIMGETGIGKTVGIELLSKLMGVMFKIVKVSAGTSIDEIIEAVAFT